MNKKQIRERLIERALYRMKKYGFPNSHNLTEEQFISIAESMADFAIDSIIDKENKRI